MTRLPNRVWWLVLAALALAVWIAQTITGDGANNGLLGFSAGMVAVWSANSIERVDGDELTGQPAKRIDRRSPDRIPSIDLRALRRRDDPQRPSPWQ